jgi:type II secretory pathway component PulM
VNEWIRRVVNAYNGLSTRERLLVTAAGGVIVVAFFYAGVVRPILGAADAAEQRYLTADQQLRVMARLRRDFDDVQHRLSDVERRIAGGRRGNLRTTLENLASRAAVKVESMEPQASPANESYRETKVEVALRSVTLAQTVNYLHQIDSADEVLSIKTLRMRTRADKPDLMDVTFTVSSFEPI